MLSKEIYAISHEGCLSKTHLFLLVPPWQTYHRLPVHFSVGSVLLSDPSIFLQYIRGHSGSVAFSERLGLWHQ